MSTTLERERGRIYLKSCRTVMYLLNHVPKIIPAWHHIPSLPQIDILPPSPLKISQNPANGSEHKKHWCTISPYRKTRLVVCFVNSTTSQAKPFSFKNAMCNKTLQILETKHRVSWDESVFHCAIVPGIAFLFQWSSFNLFTITWFKPLTSKINIFEAIPNLRCATNFPSLMGRNIAWDESASRRDAVS